MKEWLGKSSIASRNFAKRFVRLRTSGCFGILLKFWLLGRVGEVGNINHGNQLVKISCECIIHSDCTLQEGSATFPLYLFTPKLDGGYFVSLTGSFLPVCAPCPPFSTFLGLRQNHLMTGALMTVSISEEELRFGPVSVEGLLAQGRNCFDLERRGISYLEAGNQGGWTETIAFSHQVRATELLPLGGLPPALILRPGV